VHGEDDLRALRLEPLEQDGLSPTTSTLLHACRRAAFTSASTNASATSGNLDPEHLVAEEEEVAVLHLGSPRTRT